MGDEYEILPENTRSIHKVTLTYDYWFGKSPVTFDEYDPFCDDELTDADKPSDGGWGRARRPVINVSGCDAIAYCNCLSEKEGLALA